MPTRNVVITDRQAAFIEQLVNGGEYQNASEVLREGLRLVEARRAEHAAKLQALRAAVQVGIDSMDAGRYTAFDSPEALEAHLDALADRAIAEAEMEMDAKQCA
ncbi:MAG: type II toxin-antitoxin system ParD family antitoxin [Acidovorax sp.]|uniref:type II toxin-antitoxin system ParD family antitoxin n=1 Tax=Acidovorax sp. TaxID=1872122 RepID=UPI0039E24C0C